MYIAHLTVLSREAALAVGGFHAEFEGSQDHDLVLRVTERGKPVVHIPEVLYLWRMSARSTAADPDTKPTRALMVRRLCRNTASAQVLTRRWFKAKRRLIRTRATTNTRSDRVDHHPTHGSHATIRGEDLCTVVEAVRSVAKHEYSVNYEFVVVTTTARN